MSQIHQLIIENLPPKHRKNPRGWLTFNAPCCHHRGHKPDQRGRGNLIMGTDGAMGFNCYNCGFRSRFNGIHMTRNFEQLLVWLGAPSEGIRSAKLELLRMQLDGVDQDGVVSIPPLFSPEFHTVELPPHSVLLREAVLKPDPPEQLLTVFEYLLSRGLAVADSHDYYWSPSHKNDMDKRLIIPFFHRGRTVGYTARYMGTPPKGVPRYLNSSLQPGYLFNNRVMDLQDRQSVLLVEGALDAIAVDAVAALGSELSSEQLTWLKSCGKEIIVVPDRQRKNQGLIDAALANGWSVSFPDWEDDVKDAAEASRRYGKIYSLRSIFATKTNSQLQINVKRQLFKDRG